MEITKFEWTTFKQDLCFTRKLRRERSVIQPYKKGGVYELKLKGKKKPVGKVYVRSIQPNEMYTRSTFVIFEGATFAENTALIRKEISSTGSARKNTRRSMRKRAA